MALLQWIPTAGDFNGLQSDRNEFSELRESGDPSLCTRRVRLPEGQQFRGSDEHTAVASFQFRERADLGARSLHKKEDRVTVSGPTESDQESMKTRKTYEIEEGGNR